MRVLVLGGVRSGKSRHAEGLALRHGGPVTVIATGTAGDGEMERRIALHRARRPAAWRVVEEPLELAGALRRCAVPGGLVLIECLTLWLTNLLCDPDAARLARERNGLLAAWPHLEGDVIAVSNEVGLGIVPANALARRFMDEAGELHQALAAQCEQVVTLIAGLPLTLKGG